MCWRCWLHSFGFSIFQWQKQYELDQVYDSNQKYWWKTVEMTCKNELSYSKCNDFEPLVLREFGRNYLYKSCKCTNFLFWFLLGFEIMDSSGIDTHEPTCWICQLSVIISASIVFLYILCFNTVCRYYIRAAALYLTIVINSVIVCSFWPLYFITDVSFFFLSKVPLYLMLLIPFICSFLLFTMSLFVIAVLKIYLRLFSGFVSMDGCSVRTSQWCYIERKRAICYNF